MADWSNDVANILGGIGGSNGIGDDIAAIINASNGVPQTVVYSDSGYRPQPIPWTMIIIAGAGLIALYLLMRK